MWNSCFTMFRDDHKFFGGETRLPTRWFGIRHLLPPWFPGAESNLLSKTSEQWIKEKWTMNKKEKWTMNKKRYERIKKRNEQLIKKRNEQLIKKKRNEQ